MSNAAAGSKEKGSDSKADKKADKPKAVEAALVLTDDLKNTKEYKALLKKQDALKAKNSVESKMPSLLIKAKDVFGEEFKTFTELVSYVNKSLGKSGKSGGKRASKLNAEQKASIDKLSSEGKDAAAIAAELKVIVQQVKRYVAAKKAKK